MRYFRVLIFSLILHLLLGIFISQQPDQRLKIKPTTYVDLIEKPELAKRPHQIPRNEKQFVRQVEVPQELISKDPKNAKFASEEERNVLEEQRARLNDLTTNRSTLAGANSKIDFNPTSALAKAKSELSSIKNIDKFGDIEVSSQESEMQQPSSEQNLTPSFSSEKGVSSFGEAVPDSIKFGDFTALNTDRHLFYSFYARMEEKIRYRWVNYARAAVYSMAGDPRKTTGKDTWITKLEVILDPKGHFVKAVLHEGSGLSSLDSAPVQAFRDAGQFPNPPAEMVKEDGVIHIYYAFNVNMGPGALAGN